MTIPFLEPFTYSDNPLHTANAGWIIGHGGFDVKNSSVRCVGADAIYGYAYWNSDIPTADQYAQIVINRWTGTGVQWIGPALRISTSADSWYQWFTGIGATTRQLAVWNAGTKTSLGSENAGDETGAVVYLQIVGTTLIAKINGVTRFTVTDGTLSAAGRFGINGYGAAGNDDVGGDDFEGGNIGAAGQPTMSRYPKLPFRPLEIGRQNVELAA